MDCIFCKIVKGEIPAFKVFENEKVLAFLDIEPMSGGHCLVIPKVHSEDIFDIAENDLKEVISAVKIVSEKLKKSLGATGVNIINNSGKSSGRGVAHFHMHVIPRHEDDGLNIVEDLVKKTKKANPEELKKIAEKINGGFSNRGN